MVIYLLLRNTYLLLFPPIRPLGLMHVSILMI